MSCGWEGNRRSGVALAMHHRLQWSIHLEAHGLDREMSTQLTLSCTVRLIYLYLSLSCTAKFSKFRVSAKVRTEVGPTLFCRYLNFRITQCRLSKESENRLDLADVRLNSDLWRTLTDAGQ